MFAQTLSGCWRLQKFMVCLNVVARRASNRMFVLNVVTARLASGNGLTPELSASSPVQQVRKARAAHGTN